MTTKPLDDILTRLEATTKINDAYPRDIEDAINEIDYLRRKLSNIEWHLNRDKDGSYFLTEESYNELFVPN